jgi:hypothetical protein
MASSTSPTASRTHRDEAGERRLPGAAAAILARLDAPLIARAMVDAFTDAIPGYKRLPASVIEGQILTVAASNIQLFIDCAGSGRLPQPVELEPFRTSAQARAAEGMPLEDLLHAYRLGGRFVWDAAVAAALGAEQPALPELAGFVMDYLDRVSSAVANSYLEERQHLVSEEERRLRALLRSLTTAGPVEPALRSVMERLGLPLRDAYSPFAARLANPGVRAHAELAAALRGQGLLALTDGDRVTGIAAAALPAAVALDAIVVEGEPTPRGELAGALDEVRIAVDVAARTPGEPARRLTLGDLAPELLLAFSPRLAAIVRRRVTMPLESSAGPRSPDLVGTLRTLFECGLDRRRAARSLHVHPNTLDYRVRRIEELTGLDLAEPRCIALVCLALADPGTVSSGL